MKPPPMSVTQDLIAWTRNATDGNGDFKGYKEKGECAIFTCRECQAVLNQPTDTFYKKGQKDFYTGKEWVVPASLKAWATEHKHSPFDEEIVFGEPNGTQVNVLKVTKTETVEQPPDLSLPQPQGRKFRD
jgi:hypothetical protein